LAICRPVYYELLRGILWRKAIGKSALLHSQLLPLFSWVELIDKDWVQAARFWADSTAEGKQLADVDLLLAALSYRLNAILVSNDQDFDGLPIQREDWRVSSAH
jgi:predicted nucleic acid-binding protein